MYNAGDLIIYSNHGLCKIEEICEKKFRNISRKYYVIHPIEEPQLTISAPVDKAEKSIRALMDKEEAEKILESFKEPGIQWIEDARERNKKYNKVLDKGDRGEISGVLNTLMRKENEALRNEQKISDQDRKLLNSIQIIMFKELAVTLDTSLETITEKVNGMIKQTA